MNDYIELVAKCEEWIAKADNFGADDLANHISRCEDAIEQLVNDYEILAKMYAKVSDDLCVRTKERDAAVADLKSVMASECGLNQCRYCKYQEDDYQCHHDCIPYSEKWGWEWRGVKEDNDEID